MCLQKRSPRSVSKVELPHTAGTASLSACALAASVVTVLFTRADLEKAELRNGAARLVLTALENIFVVVERRQKERREMKAWGGYHRGYLLEELWKC